MRPLINSFFEWVQQARLEQKGRNLATKALGYATNQEHELRRVLADGRLPLDNTRAERSLRKIVVGRKNWMFYGSDSHAERRRHLQPHRLVSPAQHRPAAVP